MPCTFCVRDASFPNLRVPIRVIREWSIAAGRRVFKTRARACPAIST